MPDISSKRGRALRNRLQSIGLAGVLFFTLKGLIWLVGGIVMMVLAID